MGSGGKKQMSKEKRFRSFSGIQIQDSSFDVIRLKLKASYRLSSQWKKSFSADVGV